MAVVNGKSGTFNISTKNSAISGYVKWQETYDNATYTTTNKSTITMTAYLHRTNIYDGATFLTNYPAQRIAYFGSENVTNNSNVTFSIPGNTSASGGAYIQVYSASKEITHDNDGSKSISVGFYMTVYNEHTAFEVPKTTSTATLTTIPRATTPALSAASITANGSNSITITIDPAASSFKHRLRYAFGSYTSAYLGFYKDGVQMTTTDYTAQGKTTITFKPDSSLCNQIPNANSGVCTIYLYTYTSSGTHVGTKSATLTLNVPSYTPTISNVALTGNNLLSSEYVQGKSTVTVTTTATSSYEAMIKSVSVTVDGKTYSGSKITSSVLSSGSKTASVTITDTRGKTATSTSSAIAVRTYSKPSITSFTVARQSDGTTVVATVKGSVSDVNSKNAKTVTVTLNGKTQTITSSSYTINGSTTFTGISTDSTFNATAKIADSYTSDTKTVVLPTEAVTMDFHHSGTGIAMGKVAEWSGFLDLNWNLYCRKNFSINTTTFGPLAVNRTDSTQGATIKFSNSNGTLGFVGMSNEPDTGLRRWTANSAGAYFVLDTGNLTNHIKDYIVDQGANGIWTYRKWNSGIAECWGNVSTTPTTVNGNNAVSVNLPFTFVGTDYKVSISPAKAAMYIDAFGDCATNGNITHTTTSFTMAYKYSFGTAYAVSFNVNVYGKWK